jgi:hypothetical protein
MNDDMIKLQPDLLQIARGDEDVLQEANDEEI